MASSSTAEDIFERKESKKSSRKSKFRTWGKPKKKPSLPALDDGGLSISRLSIRARTRSASTHDLSESNKGHKDRSAKTDSGYVEKGEDPIDEAKDQAKRVKYREEAFKKLEELVKTEKSYINDLKEMNLYIAYMEKSRKREKGVVEMPKGLKIGKDKIVFANIQALLEFHERILPDIEKCPGDPTILPKIFTRNKDAMKRRYGLFCINKPKSDYIQSEFEDYFSVS